MNHHKYQYVVICMGGCGIQPLDYENYMNQLMRPDNRWECPKCGGLADWDDGCLETDPVCLPEPESFTFEKSITHVISADRQNGVIHLRSDETEIVLKFSDFMYATLVRDLISSVNAVRLQDILSDATANRLPATGTSSPD